MILDLEISKSGKENLISAPVSEYKPSKAVQERILQIIKDFDLARTLHDKVYKEFNDKSLLQRQAQDQQSFNIYTPPKSEDPDSSWKSTVIRPIVRNRTISIAAHTTGALIYPQIHAQNEQDEADKDAAQVMRDLLEWSADQSDYARTFLYAVISALINPGVIIHSEYCKQMRTIKEIGEDGKWKEKEIEDELMSGFKDTIVPLDELYISNVYEHDIQKQPFIIWRRLIDYSVALGKYAGNENFKYVKPGVQALFDAETATFYEQSDPELEDRLVEEVIYWNRTADLRLVFVNGVLLSDVNQPNPRKDKLFPFVKGGYELFDEGRFFYYSSLVKKMAEDEKVITELYRMLINGAKLQGEPPIGVFGEEEFDSSVLVPSRISHMRSENSKITPISNGANLGLLSQVLEKVESSASESSNDVLQSGQAEKGSQTAFEISRLEQNARIMLGMFAKMIGFMVKDWGKLRMNDILQYMTVGDVEELISSDTGKVRSFLIPEKISNGAQKSRKIEFTSEFPELKTEEDVTNASFNILEEEGGMDSKKEIMRVNPELFRELKFKCVVTPDIVTPPSDNLRKAQDQELFAQIINLPFVDAPALVKDLMLANNESTKRDPSKYLLKQQPMGMPGMPAVQGMGGAPTLANALNNAPKV